MTHPREDQFESVRAWLQSDAGSRSIDDIHAYVLEKYDAFFDAVRAAPGRPAAAGTDASEWDADQVLKHLAEWNAQVGEDILHVCLTGERPGNPAPVFEGDRESLIQQQQQSLESVYAHVTAAEPDAFLDVTWPHPFFGELNWREWFLFLGVHAIDHTGQVGERSGAAGA